MRHSGGPGVVRRRPLGGGGTGGVPGRRRADPGRPGRPGPGHLHLRLDRPAEGRAVHPPRLREPDPLDAADLPADHCGQSRAEDAGHLRRRRLGAVLAAVRRGADRGRAAGRARVAGGADRHVHQAPGDRRPLRPVDAAAVAAGRRRPALPGPAAGVLQRRGAGRRPGRGVRPAVGRATAQPVRPDRGGHRRHPLPDRRRAA
jgi:hypothetical protein